MTYDIADVAREPPLLTSIEREYNSGNINIPACRLVGGRGTRDFIPAIRS
jgi:hypothetical protein